MIGRLRHLSAMDIRIAAKAASILLEARLRLRHTSVAAMRDWASEPCEHSLPREQLLRGFRRASNRLGGTCLVRALALQRLLSLHGHASELRIGVGRTEKGFEAHAWLVDGENILEGAGEEAASFTQLAAWPTDLG